ASAAPSGSAPSWPGPAGASRGSRCPTARTRTWPCRSARTCPPPGCSNGSGSCGVREPRVARGGRRRIAGAAVLAAALLAAACSGSDDDGGAAGGRRDDCTPVPVAVSSEKIELLADLAERFNGSDDADPGDGCVRVEVRSVASGLAMSSLVEGWDESRHGPAPVVWSPASSSWGTILNQRLEEDGRPPMAPEDPTPFMLPPLVIAMPEPMARALGWPDAEIGWSRILELARSEGGWADLGHPEWGPFRLGKTNPNFSTSG